MNHLLFYDFDDVLVIVIWCVIGDRNFMFRKANLDRVSTFRLNYGLVATFRHENWIELPHFGILTF